jgi:hypothetical protein
MSTVYQGTIATDGSTKIPCTSGTLMITSIIINNPTIPYTITVNRLLNTTQSILLYEFQLDAGDSIRDSTSYSINVGNSIQIISDVPGSTYVISANQTA